MNIQTKLKKMQGIRMRKMGLENKGITKKKQKDVEVHIFK